MWQTPDLVSLVEGTAEGHTSLNAFDNALLAAGIGNLNLIKVSSIFPPKAKLVELPAIPEGSLTPVVYSYMISNDPGEVVSVAIGAGLRNGSYGLLMEYAHKGPASIAEEIVTNMVVEGFKVRGLEADEIKICSSEHKVERIGCALAAAVFWWG